METEQMTIGMCFDQIEEYFVALDPKLAAPQKATQADINRLKGR